MAAIAFPDLIARKRDGQELTDEEIAAFVDGVVNGTMAECQIGAMLMALCLKDMTENEVATLTNQMTNSGSTLAWPVEWSGSLVDKHSTGGVGDKVSLVLAPALAAVGLKVPMISGRGLEHTGGTLDKLESIPGFNVSLSIDDMTRLLSDVGCFIAGQTENTCPADRKLYGIRDVTSTVKHIGLITASIVSKKAAERLHALVLDVKTGSGALYKQEAEALQLARSMVNCCQRLGIKTVALITDMNSPIGYTVGNALEVAESIQCLQGNGPADLLDLVVDLGGHLLHTAGFVTSVEEGYTSLRNKLADGTALSKFCDMLKGQGVAPSVADALCNPETDVWTILCPANSTTQCQCPDDGYVKSIDAMKIAVVTHRLGGGRNAPGQPINWSVGVQLLVTVGDQVHKGQAWVRVHHDDPVPDHLRSMLEAALVLTADPVKRTDTRTLSVVP